MRTLSKKLRVGVTIHLREGQTIWDNGIYQNCVFLVQLLNLSDDVAEAVLVNGGDVAAAPKGMPLSGTGVRLLSKEEALGSLDVVIEMSSQLPAEWIAEFSARGGKVAWMRVGNDYAIDIERAMYGRPHASLCSGKPYDAVWTIPEYRHSCRDYFSITTRAPVRILPHLWTPEFFRKGIATLPEGITYGYAPGKPRWRVCAFEPNLSVVKTSIVPMLVCEEAYRLQPTFLEAFRVCNTLHLKENPALVRFARALDIVNHGVATFEGRFAVYEYMAHNGDCILSHHWENGQNYLYYEALHGGYPLVHNSEFLKGVGYYYPEFDAQEGGKALVRAFNTHDGNLESYRNEADRFLATLDIANPGNILAYTRALQGLYLNEQDEAIELPSPTVKPAEGIDRAFVVNLDRRPDRLDTFWDDHPGLEASVERHPAVDGREITLTPDIARLFACNTFGWSKSVMGCALSHLDLWTRLAREPEDTTWLILEDDVRLAPAWRQIWERDFLAGNIPTDWDLIYLGGALPCNRGSLDRLVEPVSEHIGRIRANDEWKQSPPNRYFHFCTYAYLLSARGARKVLDRIRTHDGIWTPTDHILCNYETGDMNTYLFHPLLAECTQEDDPSYHGTGFDYSGGSGSYDSDIRNSPERFQAEEVDRVRDHSRPLALTSPEARS